jgi:glycosyltransferase involved in cell wall biosynthesis
VVTSIIKAAKPGKWEHCLFFYGIEEMLPGYQSFCQENSIPFSFVKKKKGVFNLQWAAIARQFKAHNPDIIILHSPNLIFSAWVYTLFTKKKIFVVEHTPHQVKGIFEKVASFFSLLLARKVVCLTDSYRETLIKKNWLVFPRLKTVVIENGIDLNVFKPAIKESTVLKAGMIGRFSHQKNQQMVVDALADAYQQGVISRDFHFYFAGTGETLEKVKTSVTKKKLNNNIHFLGMLNEHQIVDLLGTINIYVHASYAETMCTSVMQAMACGLPIIASNISGINNIVQSDVNAVLFDNDDVNTLVSQLTLIYNNLEPAKKMGIAARQYAETNLSSLNSFKKYDQLIQNY